MRRFKSAMTCTRLLAAAGCFLAFGLSADVEPPRKLDVAGLSRLASSGEAAQRIINFTVEGLVLGHAMNMYSLADTTGTVIFMSSDMREDCAPGCRIRLTGYAVGGSNGSSADVWVRSSTVLEKGEAPPPLHLTTRDIGDGRGDDRFVEVCGVITDAYYDEVDPSFVYLTLSSEGANVALSCRLGEFSFADAVGLLDCAVAVRGICDARYNTSRKYVARYIGVDGHASFRILHRSDNPQPILSQRRQGRTAPEKFPHRRYATGEILACWDGSQALLRVEDGRCIRLHLKERTLPSPGTFVRALGFVRDDSYFVYLDKAVLERREQPAFAAPPPVQTVAARELLFDEKGRERIAIKKDGFVVRLEGTVTDILSTADADRRCLLDCAGVHIPVVLAGGVVPPAVGSRLAVTGVFQAWTGQGGTSRLVRLAGVSLIIRNAGDLVVLQRPPFWTPPRFWALVSLLGAVILVVIIRNRLLGRLVERRGRALFKEEIRHATAVLKIDERTRLALELHDAVAQNLTGLALRLDIARRTVGTDDAATRNHLDIAAQMLRASHDEVRACIWDLRNLAIDEPDLNEAIRRSVAHSLGDAALRVRFAVSRARLADATAHSLLRIVRELVGNAVRHGRAKTVSVAGAREGNRLLFSVSDDGVGFDVLTAPGAAEGHFGLQGIRERLHRHNGIMRVESSPHGGTRVFVEMDFEPFSGEAS